MKNFRMFGCEPIGIIGSFNHASRKTATLLILKKEIFVSCDDQIVALLEHGLREGDPVFKPYADTKGYKLKECLCIDGDFPEWDPELYEILNTKFSPVYGEDWADDMPGWDDSIGVVQREFADEYSNLVTMYEISDDGWYRGVLAVNDAVSVEEARNAFVAWTERGWLQQEV